MKNAVLLIAFNRPDTTLLVLNSILKAKPPRLYIALDGPREGVRSDILECTAVKDLINSLDWDCELKTMFSESNLGCKEGPIKAINWFFESEEQGVILEDDCLPSQSFFSFCDSLLELYKHDERIWHIDGTTFQNIKVIESYSFSRYALIWGWATWRRAWVKYDGEMKDFPCFLKGKLIKNIWKNEKVQKYWLSNFETAYLGNIDTWDYQWFYKIWCNNALTIRPSVNLVKNIGFSDQATHTKKKTKLFDSMFANEIISDVLIHPKFIIENKELDDECSKVRFGIRNLGEKIIYKMQSYF